MSSRSFASSGVLFVLAACASTPTSDPAPAAPSASAAKPEAPPPVDAGAREACAPRPTGPFTIPLREDPRRRVYFELPKASSCERRPRRLIGNLHGLCNPPGYACGYWTEAASARGFLVCPEGNATCGAGGPPTWTESFAAMGADLDRAVDAVSAFYPGEIDPRGAVLTGFSRGAYAAPMVALGHPGRWRYLVLVEADVGLDAGTLRRAGVEAVAMLAGEWGSQIGGERATVKRLRAQGYPARFWAMPKAAHYYSANVDALMGEAIDWVTSQGG